MSMQNNNNSRCNCENIFTKETLDCNCGKAGEVCNCEKNDYKCCLKMSKSKCENNCPENTSSYNIRRLRDGSKCCCETNGNVSCCCSKDQDKSCCCIVAGKDECCCDHKNVCAHSTMMTNESDTVKSRFIEKTSVHSDKSMNSHSTSGDKSMNSHSTSGNKSMNSHSTSGNKSMNSHSTSGDKSMNSHSTSVKMTSWKIKTDEEHSQIDKSKVSKSHEEPSHSSIEDPIVLTTTCLASKKRKGDFKTVDEELINELKECKKSSLPQESYDVYIVNDKGDVNSFELKHFSNQEETCDSNPNEEFLNKQVHGICIKNKQSEMNAKYNDKMKTILEKIKQQKDEDKSSPPTILEITEFSLANGDKTKEVVKDVVKNVFVPEKTCRCNGKNSCLCECNVSNVKIIESDSREQDKENEEPPVEFDELKSYSADVDALNIEIIKLDDRLNKSDDSIKSNKTANSIPEASVSQASKHIGEVNNSQDKLYYSVESEEESDSITIGLEMGQENREPSIKSPFEEDMANKIKEAIEGQNSRETGFVDALNINIGGRIVVPDEKGLEVTSFHMNINKDDEDNAEENQTPSDEIIDKLIQNKGVKTIASSSPSPPQETKSSLKTAHNASSQVLEMEVHDETIPVVNAEAISTRIEQAIQNLVGNNLSSDPTMTEENSKSQIISNETQRDQLTRGEDSRARSAEDLVINPVVNQAEIDSSTSFRSAVSCLAKAKTEGSTVEIALHLTPTEEEGTNEESTITFIEQDTSDMSVSLAQAKRNNKVGKLIEYFEELERKRKEREE